VIFGIVTLLIYWILSERFRVSLLLVASYIFYCFWDWRFAILLLSLTIGNYFFTREMDKTNSQKRKKYYLITCLVQNILVLFVFKYYNFFTEGAQKLFNYAGIDFDFPTANILLPLGLSFFIFQTSSYIIDVFRGTIAPERSFINFATFVVYFPHMAAGPIMPSKILLPQISAKKIAPDFSKIQSSIFLIVIGLFRKIVIADTLAPFVNRVFGNESAFDWKSLMLAVVAFGLQIYGDFAGYSSIARGISRLFGIEMMVNFRQPYLATSITDFWRRWHISLSSWFREYLYIPLGGNKVKPARAYTNLLVVMVIAGLWHGAALGFLFWGVLHGLFLIADKKLPVISSSNGFLRIVIVSIGWLITQFCVFFAWIFFRNPSFSEAKEIIQSIITFKGGAFAISDGLLVLTALIVSFSVDLAEINFGCKIRQYSSFIKGLILGAMLVIILIMKSSSIIPFIYFNF
jgi:alginate O-acetyltransferase complex protein AlgI